MKKEGILEATLRTFIDELRSSDFDPENLAAIQKRYSKFAEAKKVKLKNPINRTTGQPLKPGTIRGYKIEYRRWAKEARIYKALVYISKYYGFKSPKQKERDYGATDRTDRFAWKRKSDEQFMDMEKKLKYIREWVEDRIKEQKKTVEIMEMTKADGLNQLKQLLAGASLSDQLKRECLAETFEKFRDNEAVIDFENFKMTLQEVVEEKYQEAFNAQINRDNNVLETTKRFNAMAFLRIWAAFMSPGAIERITNSEDTGLKPLRNELEEEIVNAGYFTRVDLGDGKYELIATR